MFLFLLHFWMTDCCQTVLSDLCQWFALCVLAGEVQHICSWQGALRQCWPSDCGRKKIWFSWTKWVNIFLSSVLQQHRHFSVPVSNLLCHFITDFWEFDYINVQYLDGRQEKGWKYMKPLKLHCCTEYLYFLFFFRSFWIFSFSGVFHIALPCGCVSNHDGNIDYFSCTVYQQYGFFSCRGGTWSVHFSDAETLSLLQSTGNVASWLYDIFTILMRILWLQSLQDNKNSNRLTQLNNKIYHKVKKYMK